MAKSNQTKGWLNKYDAPQAQDGIQTLSAKDKKGHALLFKETENAKKDKHELMTTGQIKNPRSVAYKSKVKKQQPEFIQDNRTNYEKEYDRKKGQAKEDKKQFKKNILAPLDVVTDLMQVGNFVPHPIGQTIGKVGNILGAGIDAIQAIDDVSEEDYGSAAINAGSVFLPLALDSKTFRRNSRYLQPGQPLYPLSPQANLPANATISQRLNIPNEKYLEPFTKVQGMTDTSLLANRVLLGTLGAETTYDAFNMSSEPTVTPIVNKNKTIQYYNTDPKRGEVEKPGKSPNVQYVPISNSAELKKSKQQKSKFLPESIEIPEGKDIYAFEGKKGVLAKNGGWLDNYGTQDNYNDSNAFASPDMVGDGFSNVGRNSSPAWGGQFKEGGKIDPEKKQTSVPATRADSLAVFNNAKNLEDYFTKQQYKKSNLKVSASTKNWLNQTKKWEDEAKNYKLNTAGGLISINDAKKEKAAAIKDAHNWVKKATDKLNKEKQDVKNKSDVNKYLSNLEKSRNEFNNRKAGWFRYTDEQGIRRNESKVSPEQYYKPLNENQFYQRESSFGNMDLRSPMALYDTRITPQSFSVFDSPDLIKSDALEDQREQMQVAGLYKKAEKISKQIDDLRNNPKANTDKVEMYQYDPLAVMPFDMVPVEQQEERIRKYGASGVPASFIQQHPDWVTNQKDTILTEPQQETIVENKKPKYTLKEKYDYPEGYDSLKEYVKVYDTPQVQSVQNNLQPAGLVQNNLNTDPVTIQQPVRVPKYYDVVDTNNQTFGGGETFYKSTDLSDLNELPTEGWSRKTIPHYQNGGNTEKTYSYPERKELYPGEDEYFKANPHVGGMAAEDNQVIINPYSPLSDEEKQGIRINEAARLAMRNGYAKPMFDLTPEQKEAFKDYSTDEQDQKETIIGRILSGDSSAKNVTPEQKKYAEELQKSLKFQMGGSIPGAVGFTYARTKGIPSEGPYAKKTMPSAQNGDKLNPFNYPQPDHYSGINPFFTKDPQHDIFVGGVNPYYATKDFSVGASMVGVGGKDFIKIPADYGISGSYNPSKNLSINANLSKNNVGAGMSYRFENGGNIAQNGKEMQYYQNGLDFQPKTISKNGAWLANYNEGGVIKDDRGQWDHPGEITEIGSNQITMQGVPYPVLGISDTGDTQMMYPEKDYKFKGKKVTEYPMAKNGLRQEQKGLVNLDDLTNFTNYNKPTKGWLNKYN